MEKGHLAASPSPNDYKSGSGPDKSAGRVSEAPVDDLQTVEESLRLLARALRQYRTYPPSSPICAEAIDACHRALTALHGRDHLDIRVAPHALIVDEHTVGAGTIVEHELAHRLHRARVLTLQIDRAVTTRHLSRFCSDLLRCDGPAPDQPVLGELLVEHGVETIEPQMAYRPEVLDVGTPVASRCELVRHEQHRREQAAVSGGAVEYLYPRDKGWVRLDPGTALDTVSLTDLAVLVDDPAEIAAALLRLTDDPVEAETGATALERKFSDVTGLFAALDPALARLMFARLAHAVLALDEDRRKNLLQRTILPGLLDGQADGHVLRDFPDDDLADALCLLLELDTAAPEVLSAAVARLELPSERRDAVVPLIEERLQQPRRADPDGPSEGERGLDRLARRLVRVDAASGKDFSEFSAFDLSIDARGTQAIETLRQGIDTTDLRVERLECLYSLIRLQPNTKVVEALMRRVLPLLADLFEAERWLELGAWVLRYRTLAADLQDERSDAAEAVLEGLAAFLAPRRVSKLIALYRDEAAGRAHAEALVDAFGAVAASGLGALLDRQSTDGQAALSLMCRHAGTLAPALVPELPHAGSAKRRAIVKVLGHAGAGFESAVASQLETDDDALTREGMRALARIGTGQAASIVARQLQSGGARATAAAEESLWHFPPSRVAWQLRQLLGSREFVAQHPKIVARLLERAVQAGTRGLDEVLTELERLRFHFWSPGLLRIAHKARELRAR
jgi:hypothetical protein